MKLSSLGAGVYAFAIFAGVVAACANGSSTGEQAPADGGGAMTSDPNGPQTFPQPVTAQKDGSTLPTGYDAGEAGAAQKTMTIDAGGGGGTGGDDGGGGGGSSCSAVGPSFNCGLSPQCGCGTMETCDIYDQTTGAVECVASNQTTAGDHCSNTADCAPGLTCQAGACRPYCTGSTLNAPCTGEGLGDCVQVYQNSAAVPNDEVCHVTCDPTLPAAACGSNNCLLVSTTEVDCEATAGTGQEGDTCTYQDDCSPGFTCVNFTLADGGAQSLCQNYCAVGGDDCDFEGETCHAFNPAVTINGTSYGFCE